MGFRIMSRRSVNYFKSISRCRETGCSVIGANRGTLQNGENVRSFASQALQSIDKNQSHKFVVVGGGAGGLSVASFLSRKFPNQVAVVEPSDVGIHIEIGLAMKQCHEISLFMQCPTTCPLSNIR